jgi:hypothetical protein
MHRLLRKGNQHGSFEKLSISQVVNSKEDKSPAIWAMNTEEKETELI